MPPTTVIAPGTADELAAEYEDACRSTREAATISGLLLWLQELAASEADTMPQPPVDAVQVMTHHSAKGLEWPMVVLVDLASNVKNSIWDAVRAEHQGAFDAQQPLNNRFLRYWPWPYGAQGTVPVADVVEASVAAQTVHGAAVEEHRRLLYVSMTRARDVLVLASAWGAPLAGMHSFLRDSGATLPAMWKPC